MRTTEHELTMHERLAVQHLLPLKADYITLTVVRTLDQQLAATPEEGERWGLQQAEGRITIATPAAETRMTFALSEQAVTLIRDQLKAHESAGELAKQELSLFEHFVGVPEAPPLENGESATTEAARLTQEHA